MGRLGEFRGSGPPAAVRVLVDRIGYSTHNREQMLAANEVPVDYHALGPIFATVSKENPDPVVGMAGLREMAGLSTRPVVAIGGITLENAPAVMEAGADSVAVIGALRGGDVERTAREWIRRLR